MRGQVPRRSDLSTASLAVWQPAVLGRKCARPASSSTRLSSSPARLMRRIDAGTSSAPLRSEHGIFGGLAAGGVGEEVRAAGEQFDQALVLTGEVDATDRCGDKFRAAPI